MTAGWPLAPYGTADYGRLRGRRGFPATNPNGRNNLLLRNTAVGNGLFDRWDSNPGCDNNVWRQNRGQKVSPPCTLNP